MPPPAATVPPPAPSPDAGHDGGLDRVVRYVLGGRKGRLAFSGVTAVRLPQPSRPSGPAGERSPFRPAAALSINPRPRGAYNRVPPPSVAAGAITSDHAMKTAKERRLGRLCVLLPAAVGVLSLGCASTRPGETVHAVLPIAPPRAEVLNVSRQLPDGARDRVHVFLLNGADPVNFCDFRGLSHYVTALGYRNVTYGQMWDNARCEEAVRKLRRDDPQARVVLVGYSAGVYLVRDITRDLGRDGVQVDLLFYLGGDLLTNAPEDKPGNAARIVNVRGRGLVLLRGGAVNGADLDGCENRLFTDVAHRGLPSDPRVLEMLAGELAAVAGR